MAGLILVNCFVSSKAGNDPPPPTHASGVSSKPALDEVVAHRVLPLFFRTLRSWASSHETANGSPTVSFSMSSNVDRFATACGGGGYAKAVASAVTATMELASLRWQRETVAYGAVEALTEFLRRARSAIPSAASSGNAIRTLQAKKPYSASASRSSWEDTRFAAAAATAAALGALATLCSRCEPARERVVAVGFHSAIAHWLVGSSDGGGGGDGAGGVGVGDGGSDDGSPVQQAALLLLSLIHI